MYMEWRQLKRNSMKKVDALLLLDRWTKKESEAEASQTEYARIKLGTEQIFDGRKRLDCFP